MSGYAASMAASATSDGRVAMRLTKPKSSPVPPDSRREPRPRRRRPDVASVSPPSTGRQPHVAARHHLDGLRRRVAAEQVADRPRVRADHRDARQVAAQRQDALRVREQDRRSGGDPAGQRRAPSARSASVGRRGEGVDVAVRVLEQPEPELRVEHAADALVDHGLVEQPVADGRGEAGRVAERARELHVEPGLQRLDAGVRRRRPRSAVAWPARSPRRSRRRSDRGSRGCPGACR